MNYVLIKVFKALNINEYENAIFSISFWPSGISKLVKPSKNVKRAWPQQQFVTNKNLTWGKLGIFVGVLFHKEFRQEKDLVITLSNMVFCYQNCWENWWEKIVLVIEKNFQNSKLMAENFQNFLISLDRFIQTVKGQNNFW